MDTVTFRRFRFSHLFSRWLVLFTLAHFGHHLLTALPTPLLPFIRSEFGLDYARSGMVISVFSIAYGLSQLPGGWLADRLEARLLMTAGIIGVAASGLAIYFTRSYVWLLVCLGIMGLIGGGYHPAAPPLVCATVSPDRRGRALGIHAIGGSASFFIAPLVVAATAAVWGWRESYLVLAIPTLVFGIILYIVLGRFRGAGTASAQPLAGRHRPHQTRWNFLMFVALGSFAAIVVTAAISYLPLLLIDRFQLSDEVAAASLSVVYLAGIFANMGVGLLSDRYNPRSILFVAIIVAVAALAVLNALPSIWEAIGMLAVFGVTIAIVQNVGESYIMAGVAPERCSSVLGTYYFATIGGGGIFTPLLGVLIDRQGFTVSYIVLAGILGVAGLAYALRRAG